MLELPFKLFGLSQLVHNSSGYMILIASFGLIISIFVVAAIGRIFSFLKPICNILIGAMELAILPGFLMSVVFFLVNVSGIHILLSWFILLLGCVFFIIFNYAKFKELSATNTD